MPRRFRTDQEEVLGETEATADLVLGAPALLGIFFAAALLCAVCFGFGYTSGHTPRVTPLVESDESASAVQTPPVPQASASRPDRGMPDAADDSAATESTAPQRNSPAEAAGGATGTEPGFPPALDSSNSASKPAPGMRYASPDTPPVGLASAETQDLSAAAKARTGRGAAPAPGAAGGAAMTASVPAATVAERPAEAAPASASSDAPALNLMVQIAAVSHAADAETLASALRHDGFAAIVRTTTGDPYFHVQIGPFASLQSAKTMRAKLAGSGYNAFIRP
jgi:DedD protein